LRTEQSLSDQLAGPPAVRTPRGRRRAGRPSRIDREAIARAVGEIPVDELSVRAVADHLGVSVAALYYHVSGREELLLLAAEQSIDRIPLPADRDQHWAVWLYEWAEYARRAFGSDPTLLSRFIDGGIGVDRMVDHIETALALCVRNGFTEQEALDAYNLVSGVAVGSAIRDIRLAAMATAGRPLDVQYRMVFAERRPEELPHLRRLVESGLDAEVEFVHEISAALAGIAVRRGESWDVVVDQIAQFAEQPMSESSGTGSDG
jgi:AcrR family transcriptional regulator